MRLCRAYAVACLLIGASLPTHRLSAQLVEDPALPLPASARMSEQQRDHADATAHYAHGRLLLQRRDLAAALSRFQRAWRFDPQLVNLMKDVVPLAVTLKRNAQATRYAVIACELEEPPLPLVKQMAELLTQQQQFARALDLYERSAKRRGDKNRDLAYVANQFDIGRLAFVNGKFDRAATALAEVQKALRDERPYKLTDEQKSQLLKQPDMVHSLTGEAFLKAARLDQAEAAFRAAHAAKANPGLLGLHLALVDQRRGRPTSALKELQAYFDQKLSSAGILPYRLLGELLETDPPGRPQPQSIKASKDEREAKAPADKEHTKTAPAAKKPAAKKPADEGSADEGSADAERDVIQPGEKLVKRLTQLYRADEDNALLGYYLADQLRRTGQLKEAERIYRELLQREPAAEGYEGLIRIYFKRHQYDRLLAEVAAAVTKTNGLEPFDEVLQPVWEDPAVLDRLTREARKNAAAGPENTDTGPAKAVALLAAKAGRAIVAKEFLDRVLKEAPKGSGPFAINLGFALLGAERPEAAARAFQAIVDHGLMPDQEAEIQYHLSGAWVMAEQYEPAADAARRASLLKPNSPRMASRLAWVHFQSGRWKESREAYLDVLKTQDQNFADLENRDVMRRARLMLSTIDVQLGDMAAAEDWLQQVLDEFPEDIGAANDLGYLWCDAGKHLQRSLEMIQRAVDKDPENAAYRDSLGWALFRLGKFPQAIEQLKIAARESDDGVIFDHLGDAYQQFGDQKAARRAWKRALGALEDQNEPDRMEEVRKKLDEAN